MDHNMQGKDSVTLSAEDASQVIKSLNEQIASLTRWVKFEQERAADRAAEEVRDALRALRARGVVLLHNGEMEADALKSSLEDSPVALAAFEEAWNLKKAPISHVAIAQVRDATAGGMNRF